MTINLTDLLYQVGGYVCLAFLLLIVVGGLVAITEDIRNRPKD